jgi:O-antigen/teichoic acid export membrane protein
LPPRLALALLVAGVIANLQMAALDGLGLADRRAILSLLSTAGFAWLALWAIPRWGVAGLAAAQLAQMLLQVLAGRFLLCRALPGLPALPRRFARAALAPALAQGLRLQGSLLPLLIYEPLARVIIAQGAGLQVLAHYDLAYKLSLYARMMLQAAATPLLPELARRQTADIGAARALAARADLWLGWLALAVLGLTLLAAPAISLILFDAVLPDFLAAVGLLSLAFAVASRGLAGALWAQASGRMGWTIAGQWLIAALTLGLSLPAGRLLGPQAMVAGMALALAAGYGLAFWGNRAQMQGPRPDLHWPARKVAP